MPRPQKHVFVCAQNRPPGHPRGACGQHGCQQILDAFMFELQDRQCFDKVAVTPSGCVGPCNLGPNVLVYPEGILYCQVTQGDVSEIFEKHLLEGQPVERLVAPPGVW